MSSNRRLRQLADTLPPIQSYRNGLPHFKVVRLSGAEILKDNPDAPVNPDFFYKVRRPVYRNHEKQLIDLWKKFGQEGVDHYVRVCWLQHESNKATEASQSLFERLSSLGRVWVWIKSLFNK
jgi:hypothetical protein